MWSTTKHKCMFLNTFLYELPIRFRTDILYFSMARP